MSRFRHSNTTNVKVKLSGNPVKHLLLYYSNTTNVKVKHWIKEQARKKPILHSNTTNVKVKLAVKKN